MSHYVTGMAAHLSHDHWRYPSPTFQSYYYNPWARARVVGSGSGHPGPGLVLEEPTVMWLTDVAMPCQVRLGVTFFMIANP